MTGESAQTGHRLDEVKAGDVRALAKLLTTLERDGSRALSLHPDLLNPPVLAFRVGITGPPGAGKSTLISRLIGEFRRLEKRVAILAVDPSSPFTKGAVLGDRIRYVDHFSDPGVFIRSVGSRGSLGGLSAATYAMARAFDLAGFDIVLVETVGVGQTELEVMHVADFVSVVLVPESGDAIQGMKAGLLEIADLFVVNKGDRPGSDIFLRELESSLRLNPRVDHIDVPILKTTAITGDGVSVLVKHIETALASATWRLRRTSVTRLRAEARALLRQELERVIEQNVRKIAGPADFDALIDSKWHEDRLETERKS